MQHTVGNLRCSALVPVLRADVAAGAPRDMHLRLVAVAALRAFPDQFSCIVLYNPDLSIVAAYITVIALCVELRIKNCVIYVLKYADNCRDIVLHVRYLDIADGTARGELLELCLLRKFCKRINLLSYVNVIAVGDIVLVRDMRNFAKPLLQAFCKLVGGGLERRAVDGIVDVDSSGVP